MTVTVSCLIAHVVWLAACAPTMPIDSQGRPLPTMALVDIPYATPVYYDNSGSNWQELRTQMSTHGPNGFDAHTLWHVRWNWPGRGTAEQAAQAVLATVRQLEQQYDHDTGHGATQGAHFP